MRRIGIDARLYGIESGTGIGRYTAELLRELGRVTSDEGRGTSGTPPPPAPPLREGEGFEYVVFLRRGGFEAFEVPDERWTKVLADFRPYTIGVQTKFPTLIERTGVNLMHFTHFDHPVRCPVPFVITIHDLILLSHHSIRATTLGALRFWAKYLAYRRVLDHAIHRSLRILTPSQTVKEQIVERFGVLREKIVVTPLGMDHSVSRSPDASIGAGSTSGVSHRLSGSSSTPDVSPREPYLLYVGNAYPHKNLEQLIRVLPTIRERHPDLRLVLVGREDDFSHRLQAPGFSSPRPERRGLQASGDRTPIVFTGALPEDELRTLLAHAAAYVSPSLEEGFDLPTLEAAALSTPVVATDIPVHHEVLGDAFLPFAPNDDAALIDAIHRVLVHSELRATLVDRGQQRARHFSWRTCALLTSSAYREALAWLDHEPQRAEHRTGSAGPSVASRPPSSSRTSIRG